MKHSEDKIFKLVLTAFGESPLPVDSLPLSHSMLADNDPALPLYSFVRAIVPGLATDILKQTPPLSHGLALQICSAASPDGCGGGYIPLPPDFLRLVEFRMPDWETTLHDFSSPDSIHAIFASSFPRMASTKFPVLLPGHDGVGRLLHFFPSKYDTPAVASYIPVPSWLPDNTILFPDALLPELVARCVAELSKFLK